MSTLKTEKSYKFHNYIIAYYVRVNYEKKTKVFVPLALKNWIKKYSERIIPSKLLSLKEDLEFTSLLISEFGPFMKFKLLFTATDYTNNKAAAFHDVCDRIPGTLTIIKSNYGNIFGGYAEKPWMSRGHEVLVELQLKGKKHPKACRSSISDEDAFVFLIRSACKRENEEAPMIFDIDKPRLWYHYEAGPCWGNDLGPDLVLADDCTKSVDEQTRKAMHELINYQGDDADSDLPLRVNIAWAPDSDSGTPINLCGGNLAYDREGLFGFQVMEYQVFSVNCD